jgi:hypothetical protein
MRTCFITCLFLSILAYSCHSSSGKPKPEKIILGTSKRVNKPAVKAKELKPVLGHRFVITGDFDGDGKKETLTEHFISGIDHKETNKFYENGNYDTLVKLTNQKKPYCFISCDNKEIKNLEIATKQQLGIAYMKNEGDLDGDGADEISYVVDWADWSSVNFCNVMTYKNNKWKLLYTFEIRDWQVPDLPQTYNQYSGFGLQDRIVNTTNDTANKKIEKNLDDFKGFVKKIANNKIQIIHVNNEAAVDTTIIDLKKLPKKK